MRYLIFRTSETPYKKGDEKPCKDAFLVEDKDSNSCHWEIEIGRPEDFLYLIGEVGDELILSQTEGYWSIEIHDLY